MRLARIVCRVPEKARPVAEHLVSRGYHVEIITPEQEVLTPASLELAVDERASDAEILRAVELARLGDVDVYSPGGSMAMNDPVVETYREEVHAAEERAEGTLLSRLSEYVRDFGRELRRIVGDTTAGVTRDLAGARQRVAGAGARLTTWPRALTASVMPLFAAVQRWTQARRERAAEMVRDREQVMAQRRIEREQREAELAREREQRQAEMEVERERERAELVQRQAEEEERRRELELARVREEELRREALLIEQREYQQTQSSQVMGAPLAVEEPVASGPSLFDRFRASAGAIRTHVAGAAAGAFSSASGYLANARLGERAAEWRAAWQTSGRHRSPVRSFVYAAVVAVVIVGGLSAVQNRRPAQPLELPQLMKQEQIQQELPFGAATITPAAPIAVTPATESVVPATPEAAEQPAPRPPKRKIFRNDEEDEVVIRHFGKPARTPQRADSGVRRYSDLDD